MKISHEIKCWMVANIKRVFMPISGFMVVPMAAQYVGDNPPPPFFDVLGTAGTVILCVAIVLSIKIANLISEFAKENFDTIISRQTRYRKSDVELSEIKYRYVLESFGWAFFVIFAPLCTIIWSLFLLL